MTKSRYTLEELLAQCEPNAPRSPDEQLWDRLEPVGREFGAIRQVPMSRFRRERRSLG